MQFGVGCSATGAAQEPGAALLTLGRLVLRPSEPASTRPDGVAAVAADSDVGFATPMSLDGSVDSSCASHARFVSLAGGRARGRSPDPARGTRGPCGTRLDGARGVMDARGIQLPPGPPDIAQHWRWIFDRAVPRERRPLAVHDLFGPVTSVPFAMPV